MLEKQVEFQPQKTNDAIDKYCDSPNEIAPAALLMDARLLPIRLATLVLKTIEGIPEEEEDSNGKAQTLLEVELGKVEENMNEDAIMDVVDKAKEMIDDKGVSEEAVIECEARNRNGVYIIGCCVH